MMETVKEVFERLLTAYHSVMVYAGYHPLVVLPEHVKSNSWRDGESCIPLEYGMAMAVPIDDLKIDEGGISATLSFSRAPFQTFVPWEAVAAIEGLDPKPPEKIRPKLGLVP